MNQTCNPDRSPRVRISRLSLFALSLPPLVAANAALAAPTTLPTGAHVVSGIALIGAVHGASLNVNQITTKAIIDWSSFSVGAGGAVQLNNGSGATLNRVTGSAVSSIDGQLSATGSVYLINPNGVIIGKSGEVKVGGSFVASTLDVTDTAFLAGGDLTFSGASAASVINLGKVGALGGDVAMLAANVENGGSITAAAGDVGLIAGQSVLMRDMAVDGGKFAVLASGGSATNTGSIAAAQAELRAAGGNVYALAGNTGGVIRATGVSASGGKVFLVAEQGAVTVEGQVFAQAANGAGGAISVAGDVISNSGRLDASGLSGGSVELAGRSLLDSGAIDVSGSQGAGGSYTAAASGAYIETSSASVRADGASGGGSIKVEAGSSLFTSATWSADGIAGAGGAIAALGGVVTLADASFSATGQTGGAIRVGGDFHGAPGLAVSTNTTVNASSVLDASATNGAGGGSIVVWSSAQTAFYGTARTLGAGDIEISSGGSLSMGGFADAGAGGRLLFDPKNIAVDASAGSGGAPQFQLTDPDPTNGDGFGNTATKLPNGNLVVTASSDSLVAAASGAVYLFSGANGALISTLTGSQANDQVGSGGVTALANGNFVVASPGWANGQAFLVGAITLGSASTGIAGVVSASNSLIGSQSGDLVGSGEVTALPNGGYAVASPNWANGSAYSAGAVTWSSASGLVGAVSTSNSLTGSKTNDEVGSGGVTVLTNGNFVVASPNWANGSTGLAGAATWVNGTAGLAGAVSTINSLVGSQTGDQVGALGVAALTNGNYVVASPFWANGSVAAVGAATWGNGGSGTSGAVSADNSIIGSQMNDNVSVGGVTALANGNYVVASPQWANGSAVNAGAATWGNGATGTAGAVSSANSLTGSAANDFVGEGGAGAAIGAAEVVALTNGNYVVISPDWTQGFGAVTFASGGGGTVGTVSATNSLIGSVAGDLVGFGGVTALANGNYVVSSPQWSNGSISAAGAATWASGSSGLVGTISATNSLIGSRSGDEVSAGGITALTNGNYVVASPDWADGSATQAGAATWSSGTMGIVGSISAANSLVGSQINDMIGVDHVVALTNGNYVVVSENWANGAATDAGAVTWGNGASGTVGAVSASNSLVGSHINDLVGEFGVTAMNNGSYVVSSPDWTSGSLIDAGAVTLGDGDQGTSGAVSASNSVVGTQANQLLQAMGDSTTNGIIAVSPSTDLIVVGATAGVSVTDANTLTYGFAGGQTVTITPQLIASELATGANVTLQADNDITVNSAITVVGIATGAALSLDAGRSILINASISTNGGALNLLANAPLSAGVIDAQRDVGAAAITMAPGTSIDVGGNTASIILASGAGKTNTTSGAIRLASVNAGSIAVANQGPSAGSDIVVAGGIITTSANAGIGLTADGNIVVENDAVINVGGAGNATLNYGLLGSGGQLSFSNSGGVSHGELQFTAPENIGQSLVVNGQAYSLLFSGAELEQISLTTSRFYAFAHPIDLTGTNLTPIGTDGLGSILNNGNGFAGVLEGLGNPLSNPTFNQSNVSLAALFGAVGSTGVLSNVVVANANISGRNIVGALVGDNAGVVRTSSAGGMVSGSAFIGGLVGLNEISGDISGDTASATTTGTSFWTGGLVGYNKGLIEGGSAAFGNIQGATGAGGLVGLNAGTIAVSSAGGTVTGSTYVGGLVGWNVAGSILNADGASAATNGGSFWTGGLVGANNGLITGGSFASGTVQGVNGVGALLGYNSGAVTGADNARGTVFGTTYIGGLVGYNDTGGTITGGMSSSVVSGNSFVGGLVGYNVATITSSSATGSSSGSIYIGGLVGLNEISGDISGDTASATTTGTSFWTGGLVGYNKGLIEGGSAAFGNIQGATGAGGLVGLNAGTIAVSSAGGTVTGSTYVGGLVGWNVAGSILNADGASAATNGGSFWTGGLVGANNGLITGGSFASGTVQGVNGVGALLGYNSGAVTGADNARGTVFGTTYIGGLVGYNDTGGTITGGMSSSVVSGNSFVGGLVGYNVATITSSSATGSSSGSIYIGGLVGLNEISGDISGDTASATTTGTSFWTGGLVGYNKGLIEGGSAAFGNIQGATGAGGLVGLNAGTIAVSSAGGTVTGSTYVGGLVGWNVAGSILNADGASGAVTGVNLVGGLVGYNGGTIRSSFATGTENAAGASVGGLVGENLSTGIINDTYALGAVNGASQVGGLVGLNLGSISTSYAVGAVSGGSLVGGVGGANTAGGTIGKVYWDVLTTSQQGAAGANSGTLANVLGLGGTTGRSPYAQASYQGFDFTNVWAINAGSSRPYLKGAAGSAPPT